MTRDARAPGAAGYTLPEIMVVILIGAMIAGLTFPSMSKVLRRSRLEEAAGRLESALRLSRQKALARRTHYRMTIDAVTNGYGVAFADTDGTWVSDTDSSYTFPSGILFEGDANGTSFGGGGASSIEIVFEPRGTLSTGNAPLEILVYNDKGDTVEMEMVRTGRVRSWHR
jgi:prepilin-type N-terminal cleavage/methylation domain-containing protein